MSVPRPFLLSSAISPNRGRRMTHWLATVALLLATVQPALAQGTRADYDRAEKLPELTRGKVFRNRIDPHWLEGHLFWYRVDTAPGEWEFVLVDADKGTRGPAFDHEKLAAALKEAGAGDVSAKKLPVEALQLSENGATMKLLVKDKGWALDLNTSALSNTDDAPKRPPPPSTQFGQRGGGGAGAGGGGRRGGFGPRDVSPDGQWTAFIKDNNLHLRPKSGGDAIALSTDGTPDDPYEPRYYWSPDSKKLAALRTKKGEERLVYLIESSPKDQLQPKLLSYSYNKPGDKLPIPKPHLFDVEAKKEIPVKDNLFPNPWSVTDLRWAKDSSRFTFLYNQRGHQV